MDRLNKKFSCARKSGKRKNNAGTDKKELPAEGCSRRYGKWEESSRQKKSDDRQHYDKWTVWRYEKEGWEEGRVENAEFAVKDLPLGRTLWLIDGTYGPWRQFLMRGTIYTEGSLTCSLQQWHSQELLNCTTIDLYARSTSSDHWLSCPFEDSWYVRNGTSSDGNSSDEVFCFHNGFIHRVTWPHVSGFLPLGCMKQLVYETVVETEEDFVARITVAAGTVADTSGIFERTMVRRCTACIQINGRAFEQFLWMPLL